jgi:hypothetical protein
VTRAAAPRRLDKPRAHIDHNMPGRIRLRVPSRKNDAGYFKDLEERLARHPAVDQVWTRSLTGSALIFYRCSFDRLKEIFEREALFTLKEEASEALVPLTQIFFDRIDRWNHNMKEATRGQWDLPTLVATGLVGASFYKISKGQLFPPAWALLGNAYMLMARNQAIHDIEDAEDEVA